MPINPADVEALLLRSLTVTEEIHFDTLSELAAGQLEGLMPGFTIEPGDETIEVRANRTELWTPRYPVTEIAAINIGEAVLSSSSYTVDELGHVLFGQRALLNEWEINTVDDFLRADVYEVEYSYGFATIPAAVRGAIAGVLARTFRRGELGADGVAQESLGSYSVTYEKLSASVIAAAPEELAALRRWKRSATSVQMERR